ncbi:MAG: hypothetical protein LBU89_11170 [Fibromonadaceae bacterium]|jgi:hypothetical protein|nr:hypothetical protein [Fibromonadaceae bacterium]
MNILSKAFRTTCIPQVNRIDTLIPNEYVGKEIEIIVIPLNVSKKSKKMPHCIGIDMSGFKFNRDEINER